MRVQLISKPDKQLKPLVQVLLNRGMAPKDIPLFLSSTIEKDVVNPAAGFGEELLKSGAKMLLQHIEKNDSAFIIVDSDVDGFTSSAILINYLHDAFPQWVESKLEWGFHSGKQHGIGDFYDTLLDCGYGLLICPDSATNDTQFIDGLYDIGCETLVLDHHLSDVPMSEHAVIINSQYNYPNTQLSGAGVVWQFCRYLDTLLETNYADNYLDLCALGLTADMMDIRSIETKTLIFEGFKEKNIKNPFIEGMVEKNSFSFNKSNYKPSANNGLMITPMGAAFFCIPLVNAICRSGTMEEKELVFKSMLNHTAFEKILSNKRGHKVGEMEMLLTQALRTVTNVKNRQTRAETAAMELFEKKISADSLLDHKVLLLLLKPGEVDRNVAGLVANKLMSKYQRPCCILTRVENNGEVTYQGSMRGYTRTGVESFKDIAESSSACLWSRGHENAAGLCLDANQINQFIEDTDNQLASISAEPIYYVDYMYDGDTINSDTVLALAETNDYLGTGFERPFVYIHDIKTSENNVHVFKENTLKIDTPSGVPLMKFGATEEEINTLINGATVNAVCTCNANEWGFQISPQLMIEDIECCISEPKTVIEAWGF